MLDFCDATPTTATATTAEQSEIVGRMNNWALEHRTLTFEQVVAKYIGEFPRTTQGRAFARACKKAFDRERAKLTTQ